MRWRTLALAVLGQTLLFTANSNGAEKHAQAALIGELLDRGEKRSADALQTVTELYNRCVEASPDDLRAHYAFALVLVRQQQYDKATEVLERLIARASGQSRLLAERLRLWVSLQRKACPDALRQAEAMSGHFSPQEGPADRDGVACETARFLGQVFVYLERSQADVVKATEVRRVEAGLLPHMSPSAKAAFDDGFEQADKTYQELKLLLDALQQESRDKRESAVHEFEKAKNAVTEKQQGIRRANDSLRHNVQAQLAELGRRWQDVAPRAQRLQLQIASLEAERESLEDKEKDKDSHDYERSADYRSLGERIGKLEEQAQPLRLECQQILAQRAMLLTHAQWETAGQAADLNNLKTVSRRDIANQRRRLGNAPPAAYQAEALRRRFTALTTYVDVAYEKEKQRIQESYRE